MSHTHDMREVIVFTDGWYALQRLAGTLSNKVGGAHASLVKTICDLSQLIVQRDLHLELHLSPGYGGIPANETAYDMSKRAEAELGLDESTTVLKKASSNLNESPASPNEPTPGPSDPPTGPNTAISVVTESVANMKRTIAHLTESVTDLGNSISSLKESILTKSPTGSNQSVTRLGKLSGPSEGPTRSRNTSPEPGSRKRKQPSTDSLVESPRLSKATRKEVKRFSWELGQEVSGFVSFLEGYVAIGIAKNILRLPIPDNSFISPEWEGKGIPYRSGIDSTAVLDLFGIARTLELAIKDIDKPHTMVNQSLPQDKEFFQDHLLQTRSHLHTKSKELFIFTDDIFAFKRISGDLPYSP
ncbi:hypothetical protein N7519_006699 [Penicillium mononematosum]|uniref:uncharacterized protein n=1 Tax=Penicillium mononematosum TaxID=268346 RepID=UPI002547D2F5|nr:uncharacterized protein N7519_006699 [Penicillium mononematosum]KAJ6185398.1 hypothetical protein N7519_006699 [Penicillium mononematosum]